MSAHTPSSLLSPPCIPGIGSQPPAPAPLHQGPSHLLWPLPASVLNGGILGMGSGRVRDQHIYTVVSWAGHSSECLSPECSGTFREKHGRWASNLSLSRHLVHPDTEVIIFLEIISLLWVGTAGSWEGKGDAWLEFQGCLSLVGRRQNLAALHSVLMWGSQEDPQEDQHLLSMYPCTQKKMTLSRK